jgi:hypothetical protein
MADFGSDEYYRKYRKLKIVLLILIPFWIAGCILFLNAEDNLWFGIGIIMLSFLLLDVGIIIALLTKKYYNWILAFLLLVVLAIIFRYQRWPLSGAFFSFGFGGLGTVSLFSSVVFIKRYKNNQFLRFMGFFSSLVLFIISMGLLWRNMHWPLSGVMIIVGLITFITFLFAFVFILPNADFVNWSKPERIVFFRALIIPMIFVYGLCVLMFVFPSVWTMLTQAVWYPFGMDHVELLQKAGLH